MGDTNHRLPKGPLIRSNGVLAIPLLILALLGTACGAGGGGGGNAQTKITVAAVGNPQMEDLQKLVPEFEKDHSNIQVNIVILPENQLRQQVTQDIATHSGRFDLSMIGTYEVPLWAQNGWIENLGPYVQKSSSYDVNDLVPGVSKALSYKGNLYAVPFYAESSFLMYRKDLLSQAGVTLSTTPTWDEVAAAAKAVNNPGKGISGICLRGLPGWGEQLAPLDTVVNTFGGRWFDENWNAQLTSPKFREAVNFYINLVKTAGEPGAANSGFGECLNAYNGGKTAMWYDATVGASNFTGDAAANSGYALAPTKVKPYSGWLWAWSLGMPSSGTKKDAAWTFASWATSKDYIKLVGNKLGWNHVPPGTRTSTYQLSDYQKVAGPFAQLTLDSISHADVNHPTVDPVPYTGIQYVDIPEFQELGTSVSQQFAAAIAGSTTIDNALAQAQQLADAVGKKHRGG
ncbi:MAG TPA: sugar ABC transporter substrate-binding protein [Candidatus Acidoferrum sp.]|nr:sugar ABC transporter substrate-binding protein [Candidatus Acidoferrum sp.]